MKYFFFFFRRILMATSTRRLSRRFTARYPFKGKARTAGLTDETDVLRLKIQTKPYGDYRGSRILISKMYNWFLSYLQGYSRIAFFKL